MALTSSSGSRSSHPIRGGFVSAENQFVLYSTPWCGYCHRLKSQLQREGITFSEVDIEAEPEAALIVEQANGGNQTVPTLVFADGSALTNPSVAQVKEKLGV
ncbi:mycoredoxin [Aeromicrobium sp. YIM 150415]|nr:mycoredoxin [Aeromicrobium sp. YIM 150415]